MFNYLIIAYLIFPLIGLILLERGAYTYSFHIFGYENGVTTAYVIHLIAFCVGAFFAVILFKKKNNVSHIYKQSDLKIFERNFLVFCVMSLLIVWFFYSGYKVVIGTMGKGEFRSTLGSFGAIFYLIIKSLIPTGLCYLVLLCKQEGYFSPRFFLVLFSILIMVFGIGFKALALLMVFPAIIAYYPKVNLSRLIKISIASLCLIYITTSFFEQNNSYGLTAFEYILMRVTVTTSDISWYLWSLSETDLSTFQTFKTIIGSLGRTPLSFFGVGSDDYLLIYNFTSQLTVFIGRSVDEILQGFSVTANLFGGALVTVGKQYYFIYSFISGFMIYCIYQYACNLRDIGKLKLASIVFTYIVFFVMGWINSGDIARLFHISTIFYVFASYLFLSVLSFKFGFRK